MAPPEVAKVAPKLQIYSGTAMANTPVHFCFQIGKKTNNFALTFVFVQKKSYIEIMVLRHSSFWGSFETFVSTAVFLLLFSVQVYKVQNKNKK